MFVTVALAADHPVELGVAARAGLSGAGGLEGLARLSWRSLAVEPVFRLGYTTGEDIAMSDDLAWLILAYDTDFYPSYDEFTSRSKLDLTAGGLLRVRVARRPVGDLAVVGGARWSTERWISTDGDDVLADRLIVDVGVGVTHPLTERLALGVDVLDPAWLRETWRSTGRYGDSQQTQTTWFVSPDVRVALMLGL